MRSSLNWVVSFKLFWGENLWHFIDFHWNQKLLKNCKWPNHLMFLQGDGWVMGWCVKIPNLMKTWSVVAHVHWWTRIQIPNPNGYIVLCRTCSHCTELYSDSTPYFCTGQESESKSVSGNVNEQLQFGIQYVCLIYSKWCTCLLFQVCF